MPVLFFCALIAGCSSARVSDHEADDLFRSGQYEAAAAHLRKGVLDQGDGGRDALLYLLDEGLALHAAGKYAESNKVFQKADRIAEIKDYTSIATEAATLLTSENIKSYKGEEFENVLISAYLAMNYALMSDYENAAVEARRVNRKLELMVSQGGRKYQQNAFARYLSAIVHEAEGEWNDAYIDYKKTYDLVPGFPGLGRDLWRTAGIVGIRDQMEEWREKFGLSKDDLKEAKRIAPKSEGGKGAAEIIVIYQNGISPVKKPNPAWNSLPRFVPRFNPVRTARIEINGEVKGTTAVLHDIEAIAIENLEEKNGGMIAKKIGGVIAKEVLARQIEERTNSPLLGLLARVTMYASDQADLRSWNLLPRDLEMARFAVEPGTYTVRALPVGVGPLPEKTIQVQAGQKVFVNFRYMP